jgi:hypothetical protein
MVKVGSIPKIINALNKLRPAPVFSFSKEKIDWVITGPGGTCSIGGHSSEYQDYTIKNALRDAGATDEEINQVM